MRSRSLRGASCYLPLLLSLCIPSLLLFRLCAFTARAHPVITRTTLGNPGYVRSPLPDGSHRHHAWRLSTPCVDFVNPDKNGICVHENSPHAKYCFSSSLNVFAKAQGIVKAKHRFLVQDARYSSSTPVDSHFFVL